MADIPVKQNNFFGGVSDDPRKQIGGECIISKHFDIFSQPNRLVPYRSLEADTETSVSATDLKQYVVQDAFYATASGKLYGLGVNGTGLTKIVQKADATTGLWTKPDSSEGNGARQQGCFFEFKDYAWGFQGTNQIFKWGLLSGTPSITNSVATVGATITSVANGIIAADGNGYMAYNNVVVRIATDASTITDSAKTVPAEYKITSLTNYGSYMAIGCSPKYSYNGESKVFIWNLSSDLFAETIPWGEGELRVLDVVEGMLVGVSDRFLNNATGAGIGSMIIRGYSGGAAQVLKEVFTKALVGKTIPTAKTVKSGRLFFAAKIMTNSAGTEYHEGLWSFGRKNVNYPFSLTLDIVCEEANTSGIQGFTTAGNFFFIFHSNDGSIAKTNDVSTYRYTSIFETLILGDGFTNRQLKRFILTTAPLPTGGSVTVKVKNDDDTSFTTIGTYSTVGGTFRKFVNIESTSAAFPTSRESQFRIESTGGAEITGWLPIYDALIDETA